MEKWGEHWRWFLPLICSLYIPVVQNPGFQRDTHHTSLHTPCIQAIGFIIVQWHILTKQKHSREGVACERGCGLWEGVWPGEHYGLSSKGQLGRLEGSFSSFACSSQPCFNCSIRSVWTGSHLHSSLCKPLLDYIAFLLCTARRGSRVTISKSLSSFVKY